MLFVLKKMNIYFKNFMCVLREDIEQNQLI
jgi:hypothetical protein